LLRRSLNVAANNTNGNASYNLKSNGSSLDTKPATANYTYNHITSNQNYELEVTAGTTVVKKFTVIVNGLFQLQCLVY
jgi:hypothetical protein